MFKNFFFSLLLSCPLFIFGQSDFYALGQIEMREGNYSQAEQYFYRAVEIDPNNATLLNALATSQLKQRKFSLADSTLQIATQKDSSFLATYWNLGIVNVNLKRDSLAVVWFKKHIHFGNKVKTNPAKTQMEIIRCYDRLMKREGLSETQLQDLYHTVDTYIQNNPEHYGEIKMLEKMMQEYSPLNPKFKKIEGKFQWVEN